MPTSGGAEQILFLAGEDGLDDEHPTFSDVNVLFGVLIELEQQIKPTHVRARDDSHEEVEECVEDPLLRDVLVALQRFAVVLPSGPRPVNEKAARALRKARNEHIDYDLLGYVRGPLAHSERHGEEHYLYLMRHGNGGETELGGEQAAADAAPLSAASPRLFPRRARPDETDLGAAAAL